MKKTVKITILTIGYSFINLGFPTISYADDPSEMSCGELWYARNQIYARNGFCFKTEAARSQFGDGCFPPYGRLSGWEKSYVNTLQMWERRRGC